MILAADLHEPGYGRCAAAVLPVPEDPVTGGRAAALRGLVLALQNRSVSGCFSFSGHANDEGREATMTYGFHGVPTAAE